VHSFWHPQLRHAIKDRAFSPRFSALLSGAPRPRSAAAQALGMVET